MHVHILGLVSLNGGDAAILIAQRRVLQRQWPGARVSVSDTHPEAAATYLPDIPFVPFLLPALAPGRRLPARARAVLHRARCARVKVAASLVGRGLSAPARAVLPSSVARPFQEMVRADVIAYTGGTTLTDNYNLADKVFDLDVARRLRKPLVFLPQSAGPFRKPENREGLRPVLAAADLVLLRDERSLQHVVEIGADPARCRVVPDVVFALARPELADAERVEGAGPPRLAVSVREWAHFRDKDKQRGMADYADSLRAAVTSAVRERGAEVTFVSTCQGRPEYVRDDSEFALRVAEGLPEDVREHVVVDRAAHHPEELIDVLAGFDAMLSTRLHGAISAVCTGVPTLTIAYEYKTTEVWGQLGLPEWTVDIDDVTPQVLSQRVLALLDDAPRVRKQVAAAVPAMAAGAEEVGALVAGVLQRRSA
ncbi:polysaccharide pyruvyl transferase family protein [Kineococcus sp. SYSU DK006]|uniref:polysaccharide pyruvyl transferase family protein n=1 Tax=Kineococcus sp. SYSU DK006 TaxID=3383127 RepID=UPI003D7EC9B3